MREIPLALAWRMAVDERVIDLPRIADWPNRPWQAVDHAIGKPSLTRLRVAGYDPALDATLVDLFPETGRSHPLRVHLLLHAAVLAFFHPLTATELRVESGAPF